MEITTSERALLGLFMAKIHRIDPDVLVVCKFTVFVVVNSYLLVEFNKSFASLSKSMNCCNCSVIKVVPQLSLPFTVYLSVFYVTCGITASSYLKSCCDVFCDLWCKIK